MDTIISIIIVVILILALLFLGQIEYYYRKMVLHIKRIPDLPEGTIKIILIALFGGFISYGVRAMNTSDLAMSVIIGVAIFLTLFILAVIEKRSLRGKQALDEQARQQFRIDMKQAVQEAVQEALEEDRKKRERNNKK